MPVSHLSRPLCDLETDTPPVLCVRTLGFNFDASKTKRTIRSSSAADMGVDLVTFIAEREETKTNRQSHHSQ